MNRKIILSLSFSNAGSETRDSQALICRQVSVDGSLGGIRRTLVTRRQYGHCDVGVDPVQD